MSVISNEDAIFEIGVLSGVTLLRPDYYVVRKKPPFPCEQHYPDSGNDVSGGCCPFFSPQRTFGTLYRIYNNEGKEGRKTPVQDLLPESNLLAIQKENKRTTQNRTEQKGLSLLLRSSTLHNTATIKLCLFSIAAAFASRRRR